MNSKRLKSQASSNNSHFGSMGNDNGLSFRRVVTMNKNKKSRFNRNKVKPKLR